MKTREQAISELKLRIVAAIKELEGPSDIVAIFSCIDKLTALSEQMKVLRRSRDLEKYEEAEKGLAVATACVEIQERLLKPGLERQCCDRWKLNARDEILTYDLDGSLWFIDRASAQRHLDRKGRE